MDEQMIELIARAMKPELFEGGPDETRGPATRYERDFARKMARAAHSVIAGKVAERDLYLTGKLLEAEQLLDRKLYARVTLRLHEIRAALAPYPERRHE